MLIAVALPAAPSDWKWPSSANGHATTGRTFVQHERVYATSGTPIYPSDQLFFFFFSSPPKAVAPRYDESRARQNRRTPRPEEDRLAEGVRKTKKEKKERQRGREKEREREERDGGAVPLSLPASRRNVSSALSSWSSRERGAEMRTYATTK
ncbi:hypothetical protein PUN28_013627 [Cardiocondyla obscurior]|uniref:Uncharacterized protein n=1 Tax=Cardiocondyla obscurior TaxID=286306 RepID=A0AAW2F7F2_9HYME